MEEKYREAFSELEQIIQIMPTTLKDKIPEKLKKMIKDEKSKSYITKIKEPIKDCILKPETKVILSLIYRDFLCSKEKREELIKRDRNKLIEEEKKLKEKYNYESIFKNKNINIINKEPQTQSLVVVKEKWYKKVFNLIKFFLKNK